MPGPRVRSELSSEGQPDVFTPVRSIAESEPPERTAEQGMSTQQQQVPHASSYLTSSCNHTILFGAERHPRLLRSHRPKTAPKPAVVMQLPHRMPLCAKNRACLKFCELQRQCAIPPKASNVETSASVRTPPPYFRALQRLLLLHLLHSLLAALHHVGLAERVELVQRQSKLHSTQVLERFLPVSISNLLLTVSPGCAVHARFTCNS